MIGIKSGDTTICVADFNPVRKRPCLCVLEGNTITKYATFNNDQSAEEFMNILAKIVKASTDSNN